MNTGHPSVILLAVLALAGTMLGNGVVPLWLLLPLALLPLAVLLLTADGMITLASGIPLAVLVATSHLLSGVLVILLLLNALLWALGVEWRGYGAHAFLAVVLGSLLLALLPPSFGLHFVLLIAGMLGFTLAFVVAGIHPLVQEGT